MHLSDHLLGKSYSLTLLNLLFIEVCQLSHNIHVTDLVGPFPLQLIHV